ncbi:hypothetical protein C1646_775615 [Rhizophagus diaphanus]|nr:hypothetical protein C1646_775615 [Rhizophagus diaphanus] [Rhizophagus sp. MUCL 43196]
MSTITTKFVTDHKLNNEMSLKELSQYAPEILELLTTGMPKVDKEKRRQARDHLQKGYKFSKEQAYALILHERIGRIFRSLEKNEERARQLLTWIQEAISFGQLRDSGKPRSTYLSTFLKKDEFIPEMESCKPLLPSSLRKLESVFASVAHGPKNPSKANTYASEVLRHSPDNHASPSKRYTIVNMRKRGELYNQAEPFCIFDEN